MPGSLAENRESISDGGSITQLFRFQASAVILMDYDEGRKLRLLSLGHFSVNLFMHITLPILATFCSVDGFQWPLAKDTIVVRMAKRTFAFALPGLLYGLQLPKCCPEELIDTLVKVLMHFGHYKDINDNGLGYPVEDNEPNIWNKLRPQIEPLVNKTLMRLGQLPGSSHYSIPNLNSCFLRSCRMSAITKLIIESMRNGTLTSTQIAMRGTTTNPLEAHQGKAYASVSVFSCAVDAIELAWVVSGGLRHMLKDDDLPLRASSREIGFQVWILNEEGLLAFMQRLEPVAEKEEKFMNEKEERWQAKDKGKEEAEASGARANDKGKEIIP